MTDTTESKQSAPVDWQAIARRRERELKREGEHRRRAEEQLQQARDEHTEFVLKAHEAIGRAQADAIWMRRKVFEECDAIEREVYGQHDEDDDGMREAARRVRAVLYTAGQPDKCQHPSAEDTGIRGLLEHIGIDTRGKDISVGSEVVDRWQHVQVHVQPDPPTVAEAIRDIRTHGVPPHRI